MELIERPNSFFFNVTGEKAQELLLQHGKYGDFLVRPSESNKNDHTLSVHRGDRVTHVKIPTSKEGLYMLPDKTVFNNLSALVDHICQENVFAEPDGSIIELKEPFNTKLSNKFTLFGCDKFFHPLLSGKEAESILSAKPSGTFLLRESSSTPGEYVIGVRTFKEVLHIKILNVNGRFRVGPFGEAFKTLMDLVDNYTKVSMFQTNGQPVPLEFPLQASSFLACMIDERLEHIFGPSKRNPNKSNTAEEFDVLQNDLEPNIFNSKREGRKAENANKNRYKNVLPFDDSRIKLRTDPDEPRQSDYINASYVEVLHDEKYKEFDGYYKKYISTQGCLENTIGSFWRMVWQENSRTIVMITKEVERGKVKCVRYWPEIGVEWSSGYTGEILVKGIDEVSDENFIRREFELKMLNKKETRKILHFQFLFWDDNDCPANSVQAYMDEVNQKSDEILKGPRGPMIVHCSAGIGRTGTYLVIDILIGLIKHHGLNWPIDVAKAVRMVREQRNQMVQNESQYRFIYEAVRAFVHSEMAKEIQQHGVFFPDDALLPAQLQELKINGINKARIPSPTFVVTSNEPQNSSSTSSFSSVDLSRTIPLNSLTLSPPPIPKKTMKPPPIPEKSKNHLPSNYVNSSECRDIEQ